MAVSQRARQAALSSRPGQVLKRSSDGRVLLAVSAFIATSGFVSLPQYLRDGNLAESLAWGDAASALLGAIPLVVTGPNVPKPLDHVWASDGRADKWPP